MGYLIGTFVDTVVGTVELAVVVAVVTWLFSGPTDCCNAGATGDLQQ